MLFKSAKKGDRVAHELPAGKVVPALVEKTTPKYIYVSRGIRFRREDGEQYGGERRYGMGGDRIRPITFKDLEAWDAEATRGDLGSDFSLENLRGAVIGLAARYASAVSTDKDGDNFRIESVSEILTLIRSGK